MCDCRSYNISADGGNEVVVDAPEWSERDTICLDACIAVTVQELWERGLHTLGSCCGHNKENPNIVIPTNSDPQDYFTALKDIDKREWTIFRWDLVKYV